ncbi:MAG: hypothetical protein QF464_17165, partial [Myxococcota bacterium]|nr:hypothetical protein [Myxococcota bacterium]
MNRRYHWGHWVLIAAMAALQGCEASGTGAGGDAGIGSDSGITQWGDANVSTDTIQIGGGKDTGGVEDVVLPSDDFCLNNPGSFLCPCETNDDCYSGYCIPSSEGIQLCSKTCEASCPAGWSCKPDPSGAESSYICIEDQINLCRPCQSNEECKFFSHVGDRCVFVSDEAGSFCGTACEDDGDCQTGYGCQEVPDVDTEQLSFQCVKLDGECGCSTRAVAEAAATTCLNAQCSGSRVCTDEGLTACNAPDPEPEICDGLDNNCNGQVDEGFDDGDGDGMANCVDEDDDNDGALDVDDNCPLVDNPGQEDDDDNGVGNLCDPPMVPEFIGTEPPSPANNTQPNVLGTGEPGSIVYIYADDACDAPEAATVVGDDGTWMVMVIVPDGTTTILYAAAESSYGVISDCTPEGLVYQELGDKATPVILDSDPSSPANHNSPTILGIGEPHATIRLFTEEGCVGDIIGEGTADASGNFAVD